MIESKAAVGAELSQVSRSLSFVSFTAGEGDPLVLGAALDMRRLVGKITTAFWRVELDRRREARGPS